MSQYELAPEMVAVVDAHCALYVWLGAHCTPRTKDDARLIAHHYLTQGLIIPNNVHSIVTNLKTIKNYR